MLKILHRTHLIFLQKKNHLPSFILPSLFFSSYTPNPNLNHTQWHLVTSTTQEEFLTPLFLFLWDSKEATQLVTSVLNTPVFAPILLLCPTPDSAPPAQRLLYRTKFDPPPMGRCIRDVYIISTVSHRSSPHWRLSLSHLTSSSTKEKYLRAG